jgi:hypothetical protein
MKYKHGFAGTRIYKMWQNMKSRCYNKNASKYYLYGGKGIAVCNDWKNDFMSFYIWAKENGYDDSLTIDRIDANKGYSPENCKFATYKEQNNHTTQTHFITYMGLTMGIQAWADYLNVSVKMLSERIRRGWSIERAFTQPIFEKKTNIKGYDYGTTKLSNRFDK